MQISPSLKAKYVMMLAGSCRFYKTYKSMRQMESNTPKDYGQYLLSKKKRKK